MAAPRFPSWLLITPTVVAATVWALARYCHPLWLGGSTDPSYPYLANSLLLAEGRPPALTLHPGTTLQLLGALVLRLVHAAAAVDQPLRLHVLRDPELFLSAIQIVLVGLNAAALTFVGWAAWRLTGDRTSAVAAQAGPLAAAAYVHCAALVMCEPLLTSLGAALTGFLLLQLRPGGRDRYVLVLGTLAGLGIATKLTAAPFAFVPLFFLHSWRSRFRFLATTALVAATILLVALPRLGWTLVWFVRMAARPGLYADGPEAAFGPGFLSRLGAVVGMDWLMLVMVGLLATVAVLTRRTARGDEGARGDWRGLGAILLVQLLGLLATARQGGLRHYVIPLAAFTGLGLVLAHRLLQFAGQRRWPVPAGWVVVLAIAAHQGWSVSALLKGREGVRPGALLARSRAARLGLDRLVLSDRASDPAAALSYANGWAGGAFGEDLRRLFPNVVLYNESALHSFGRPIEARDLQRYVAEDGFYRFWTSKFMPLEHCAWFVDPRRQAGPSRGRDIPVRVAAQPPYGAGGQLPAFVGFLAIEGLGRFRLPDYPPKGALWGAGPATRLGFMGTGGTMSLRLEHELVTDEEQGIVVRLNGNPVLRRECRSGIRTRESLSLATLAGPNEVRIDYARQWPDARADASRPPGDPPLHPTGVLFHSLQVTQ